jgi:mono/diheme cytochrome c family protein
MSTTPLESEVAGRGAAKRRAHQEEKLIRETLRWWRKPGVLVFLGALVLAGAGWALLIRATRRLPVQEATLGGLTTRLVDATWILDQMEHGDTFQQPVAMAPGMPAPGMQRVTVNFTLHNRAKKVQEYLGHEYELVPEFGEPVPPVGAAVGEAPLEPGQRINTAIMFDIDAGKPHGRLSVRWRRGSGSAYFPVPEPVEHAHLRPRGVPLPGDARILLPIGKASRGQRLFDGPYACSSCHGDPKVPDSNFIGPHLGDIGIAAGTRSKELSAEQYIYESITDPELFIAPKCKGGVPCESPSAMPDYGSLLDLQDAADLLAYLLEQKGEKG